MTERKDRIFNRLRQRIGNWLIGTFYLDSISTKVADGQKGWNRLTARPNDQNWSDVAQLYRDALEATRKNPMAKSIINITTDFVLGDGILIGARHRRMQRFLRHFWNHRLNFMDQRLQPMSDELARAGDLFIVLFRNQEDGMSYVRFVTKEQIVRIVTADNDWETEIEYHQVTEDPLNPVVWLSPQHPKAADSDAVMLHYYINRPIGASFGEGDLDTVIPWLLRYSRMLEDRVRLHWSLRSFLWFVTVPTSKVDAKQSEYQTPPQPGSIVVKDDAEEWDVKTPNLHAVDARHDMQAVRHMVDAVGFPPHWRGEGGDANLATASAMQLRPERHLRRRQNYLVFILQDVIWQAYDRFAQLNGMSAPSKAYHKLFTVNVSDISRTDNTALAAASKDLTASLTQLFETIPAKQSPTLAQLALRLVLKFAGEPQDDETVNKILFETGFIEDDSGDQLLSSNGRHKEEEIDYAPQ
jgi:hypothetical protein